MRLMPLMMLCLLGFAASCTMLMAGTNWAQSIEQRLSTIISISWIGKPSPGT